MYDAFVNIEHFETEMIVLHPCVDVFIAVQFVGFRRLPGAVENAEVDMRPLCEFAGSSGIPGPHVARRNDRSLRLFLFLQNLFARASAMLCLSRRLFPREQ